MTGLLWGALGVLGGLGMTAIGDMVSEEVRDRLDHVPHAILRLAAARLDPAQRAAIYDDEWMPELAYILKGDEARPITRLYHGTRYAIGIMVSARRITRQLNRTTTLVSYAQALNFSLEGASLKLRIPELSGFGIGDEIRLGESLGDGKFRMGADAYVVTGVVDEHEWLVRRVRRSVTEVI